MVCPHDTYRGVYRIAGSGGYPVIFLSPGGDYSSYDERAARIGKERASKPTAIHAH